MSFQAKNTLKINFYHTPKHEQGGHYSLLLFLWMLDESCINVYMQELVIVYESIYDCYGKPNETEDFIGVKYLWSTSRILAVFFFYFFEHIIDVICR